MRISLPRFGLFAAILSLLLSVGILGSVTGCAALGLATPQSFDQKLANAYGVHTAVVSTAATAVTAGALTSDDGAHVQILAIQSRQLLDAAKVAEGAGDPTTAAGRLALATSVLTQLQTFLAAKQGAH